LESDGGGLFSRWDRSFSFQFAPQKKKNQKETGSTARLYV
jgi:hypothetical protein